MAKINQNYISTGSAQTGQSPGGVRAPMFNSALAGAGGSSLTNYITRLRPATAKEHLAKPLLDRVGPVVDARHAAAFTNSMLDATLKIADRENTLKAKEAMIEVRKGIRELGYDEENGYFMKEGRQAVEARAGFQNHVSELVNRALMDQDPDVRAKMFDAAMSEQNQARDNASRYSVVQAKKWEDDVQAKELNDIADTIPEIIADGPRTKQFIKQNLDKIFPNNPDGTINAENAVKRHKAYNELAKQQVSHLLAIPGGSLKATQRFNELYEELDLDTQTDIMNALEARFNQENTSYRQAQAEGRRIRKEKADAYYAEIYAQGMKASRTPGVEVKPVDPEDVRLGLITPGQNEAYDRAFFGDGGVKDPGLYYKFSNALLVGELEGEDVTDDTVIAEALQSGLHRTYLDKLMSQRLQSGNREQKVLHKNNIEAIKTSIRPNKYAKDFQLAETETAINDSVSEYWARVGGGEEPYKVTEDIYKRQAGGNILQMDKVQPLWNGAHISNMETYDDIQDQILLLEEEKERLQKEGTPMAKHDYYSQRRRLILYRGIMLNNAKLGAR